MHKSGNVFSERGTRIFAKQVKAQLEVSAGAAPLLGMEAWVGIHERDSGRGDLPRPGDEEVMKCCVCPSLSPSFALSPSRWSIPASQVENSEAVDSVVDSVVENSEGVDLVVENSEVVDSAVENSEEVDSVVVLEVENSEVVDSEVVSSTVKAASQPNMVEQQTTKNQMARLSGYS
ncbi:hypothetical protein FHG87_013453 [Trinorchestia longiramus]|nr:hypothetical protein FHG87_013453 [Trinorchestia longiramus]